jgi:hypothetical protein
MVVVTTFSDFSINFKQILLYSHPSSHNCKQFSLCQLLVTDSLGLITQLQTILTMPATGYWQSGPHHTTANNSHYASYWLLTVWASSYNCKQFSLCQLLVTDSLGLITHLHTILIMPATGYWQSGPHHTPAHNSHYASYWLLTVWASSYHCTHVTPPPPNLPISAALPLLWTHVPMLQNITYVTLTKSYRISFEFWFT